MSKVPVGQAYPSKLDPAPAAQDKFKDDIPAKATPDSVVHVSPKPAAPVGEKQLCLGGYKISTRADSGYRILYKVVASEGDFEASDKALGTLDPADKVAAKKVLDKLFVKIDKVEQAMRADPTWAAHCERKLLKLKQRAANGDKNAQRVIENESRVKGGTWLGDIKEMISTCNGSSSETADNRNIRKFKAAGLSFMMYPRRPRRGEVGSVAIFPIKHLDKVKKAIATVYEA